MTFFLPHYIQMTFYWSLILKKFQYFDAVIHTINTKYKRPKFISSIIQLLM